MRLFVILFFIITACSDAKRHRSRKLQPQITEKMSRMLYGLDYRRNNDPSEDKYRNPVPFGHIYGEGFEDPRSDYKRPIDLLELDTFHTTDRPNANEIFNKPLSELQKMGPYRPYSPIDLTDDDTEMGKALEQENNNETFKNYWNYEALLIRNLQDPPKYRLGGGQVPRTQQERPKSIYKPIADLFSPRSFDLLKDIEEENKALKNNFSTCDEFGYRAKFHPNDIINLEWLPFYIWTNDFRGKAAVSRIHRFTFPTKRLSKTFRDEFGPFLNKTLDWDQPKLLLKHGLSEFLLIALDRTGLFEGIPYLNLPSNMKENPGLMQIPTTSLRLKIVDPYLVLMYCDHEYATAMAVLGSEPETPRECTKEAKKVKILGMGFPVRRNLEMEAMEMRSKMAANGAFRQDEFISIDQQDQGAGVPMI